MSIFLIMLSYIVSPTIGQLGRYEVYYEWKQVDYNFPNDSVRDELIQNGGFVQLNCVPTAIKISHNQIFTATPRYLPGVPSTLNVISYKKPWIDQMLHRKVGPKLSPFPNWEMQEVGNCSAFQLVQALELDPYNRLWVLDVGRVELLTPEPRNLCPAKLVIFDLANGNNIDRVYEFPESVVPRDTNVVKDLQIACTSREDCFTYISNLNGTTSIVVYDYKMNDSWYATHPSMVADLDKANITINGTTATVLFGITGLGLTPKSTNHSSLFFSKIAGDHIYTLPTAAVNNRTALKANPNLGNGVVQDLGQKPSGQADGTAMDNSGRWYFGSLPESAIYYIDTNTVAEGNNGGDGAPLAYTRVFGNTGALQWPDTFSFDGAGYLLFTTTRFQLVATAQINPQEVNYRLIRFRTNSLSYQN